jgi:hypothetical protein
MKKVIVVHLVGAGATSALFVFVVSMVNDKASIAEYLSSHSDFFFGIVVILASVFFVLIVLIHFVVTYIFFLFTPESRACGLYLEAYLYNDDPRLSLLVVSFDILQERLRVAGHTYRRGDSGLDPCARWRSRAVSPFGQHDGAERLELFYIHQSDLTGSLPDQGRVLGTTVNFLPLNAKLWDSGLFCELKSEAETHLSPGSLPPRSLVPQSFEIIRARRSHEREFESGMSIVDRCTYALKLKAPPESVFQTFVLRRKGSLLEDFEGAKRGNACKAVFEAFKMPIS